MKRNRSRMLRALSPKAALVDRRGMGKRRRHQKRTWLSSAQVWAAVIIGGSAIIAALITALAAVVVALISQSPRPSTGAPVVSGRIQSFTNDAFGLSASEFSSLSLLAKCAARSASFPYWITRSAADMRVPDEVLKCVVFIGIKNENVFIPKATGFLVSSTHDNAGFFYVVTAEHVISGLSAKKDEIFVRINKIGGGAEDFKVPFNDWRFHPDDSNPTDVAVSFLPISHKELDIKTILLNRKGAYVVQRSQLEDNLIEPGHDVAIVGLFRSHFGKDHNIPVVRMGHIASINRDPVYTHYCGYVDAYLVEANSISGLSGSPVFAIRSDPFHVADAAQLRKMNAAPYLLLGLMHGHFDVRNLNEDVVSDGPGSLGSGLNSGIGVVIPSDKIIETIFQPELDAVRKEIMEMAKKRDGVTSDFISDEKKSSSKDEVQSTDENPNAREDFMRLASAAARKQKQGE
jgi:Trypsin-like peptidase domain